MTTIIKNMLRGIVAIVPIFLTVSVVWWIVSSLESLFHSVLNLFLPEDYYLPGIGILLALVSIFFVGVFTRSLFLSRLFTKLETLITKVPLVKTIYGSTKDFFQFFINKETRFSKVVLLRHPNFECALLGFTTSENPQGQLGDSVANQIAVYLPMSYQLGGFTVFVEKQYVTPLEMTVEDALRFALTAGVSQKEVPISTEDAA
ncbi:MAG: DUF502 domain-containing protein [Bdellovibrionales bacterium]|nr:DUF502 domain-containing protein [Bdellovibrionales bacterium]